MGNALKDAKGKIDQLDVIQRGAESSQNEEKAGRG